MAAVVKSQPVLISAQSKLNFPSPRILKLLMCGFISVKQQVPIILMNVEANAAAAISQMSKNDAFKNADTLLQTKGTTLGDSSFTICSPTANGVVIINKNNAVQLTRPLGAFPNSMDASGNVFFTLNAECEQPTRQALRGLYDSIGFPNASRGEDVIFAGLTDLLLMLIAGHPWNEYTRKLQSLAKIQTSKTVPTGPGVQSHEGLYAMWKKGMLPRMYFKNPETHTSLYKNKLINPFELSPLVFWAAMMLALGLFEQQKHVYMQALEALGLKALDEESFLEYLRVNFGSRISGQVQCVTVNGSKLTSIITLEEFEEDDLVYILNDHGVVPNQCTTKTPYSATELRYVKQRGCVWCDYIKNDADFYQIEIQDSEEAIRRAMASSRKLTVLDKGVHSGVHSGDAILALADPSIDVMPVMPVMPAMPVQKPKLSVRSDIKCACIYLFGITGAGKSTAVQILVQMLQQAGTNVLVLSSDKYKKDGLDDFASNKSNFEQFESMDESALGPAKMLVVLVDLCNELGAKKKIFGCNLSNYKPYMFYPNMIQNPEHFADYEHWCLKNLLSRQVHSVDTTYWLNPVSAGIETCLMVHNKKTNGIKKIIGNLNERVDIDIKMPLQQVFQLINQGASRYSAYLKTKSLDADCSALVESILKN